MAWLAEDTFESYSDGVSMSGASGGSNWSGNWTATTWTATTASAFQGSKAARTYTNSLKRSFTGISSGTFTMYFSMMSATTAAGYTQYWILDTTEGKGLSVMFHGSNIEYQHSSGQTTFVTGYTTSTWYTMKVVCNRDAWTYDLYYSTAAYGASESWTTVATGISMYGTAADLTMFAVYCDNLGAGNYRYVDYISPTNPYSTVSGPTTVKTWDGVTQSTGVKTYMDVALANVKSVNGAT